MYGHMTNVVEVANDLFLTGKGEWVTDWRPNVQSVAQIGMGTIELGTRQQLMSGETKDKIVEKLGLWGNAKGAFEYGWDTVAVVSGAWGYYQGAMMLLTELGYIRKKDPLVDALIELQNLVTEIDNKINWMVLSQQAEMRQPIRDALHAVQTAVPAMLDAPGTYERESLKAAVESAQNKIASGLLHPDEYVYMTAPINYNQYWGCEWLMPTYLWRLKHPLPWEWSGSQGVPVWLTIGQGASRPDVRAMLGVTLEGAVTLIAANTVLDPGFRTTGRYRDTFLQFAEVLRSVALRTVASIQITRPIDLTADANDWAFGDPAEWKSQDESHKYWDAGT